jgi:hypothetical protein
MPTHPRPEITRLAAALAGLGLCLVGGCATLAPSDSPAAWNLVETDQETKLAWGRPDSDEVGLMLSCTPHSGQVTVSAPVEAGASRLMLASDRGATAFSGPVDLDPETGAPLMTARSRLDGPTLAAFARTGRLSAVGAVGATVMTAQAGDRGRVRTFFNRCAA